MPKQRGFFALRRQIVFEGGGGLAVIRRELTALEEERFVVVRVGVAVGLGTVLVEESLGKIHRVLDPHVNFSR